MSRVVNYFFTAIERVLSFRYINIFKTIYVNFRLLPFQVALKLPIYVIGQLKVIALNGKVIIDSENIRSGMIRLGCPISLYRNSYSQLHLSGKMIFKGKTHFLNGYSISVQKNGELTIGNNVYVADNVTISVVNSIEIGNYTRFAGDAILMDSDVHFTIDIKSREIMQNTKQIKLGEYNWITKGNRIYKGTITPNFTIISSGSLTNRDYTKVIPEFSMIGGIPAKLIKEGMRRIYNERNEKMLNAYFAENEIFTLSEDEDVDEFCIYKKENSHFWESSV